ncbi:MAG: methyltransferase domain-containing protein [Candidatus Promineifilaceae bacterium]|nr:class I SAM-dependent methyltransferase [Anaerolineaceae bacterium]
MQKLWVGLIKFGFRLLYQEMAWTYDWVSWLVSLGEWRRWQLAALPYLQGPTVLEIGHGPGHLLLAMQKAGHTVFGLDLSAQMGRQARRRLHKRARTADLVRARVQEMPFASASFNTVLATFPTEYIVDPQTLAAVQRVLVGNGRFLIVPEGHLTGRGGLYRIIDWLFRITGQRDGAFQVDEAHNWPHPSLWEPFRQRFVAAGFSLQIEQVTLARSVVTLFIAHKSHTPNQLDAV